MESALLHTVSTTDTNISEFQEVPSRRSPLSLAKDKVKGAFQWAGDKGKGVFRRPRGLVSLPSRDTLVKKWWPRTKQAVSAAKVVLYVSALASTAAAGGGATVLTAGAAPTIIVTVAAGVDL